MVLSFRIYSTPYFIELVTFDLRCSLLLLYVESNFWVTSVDEDVVKLDEKFKVGLSFPLDRVFAAIRAKQEVEIWKIAHYSDYVSLVQLDFFAKIALFNIFYDKLRIVLPNGSLFAYQILLSHFFGEVGIRGALIWFVALL